MRYLTLLATLATLATLAAKAQVGGGQGQFPSIPTDTDTTSGFSDATSGFSPWLMANGTYGRSLDVTSSGAASDAISPTVVGGIAGWKNWNRKKFTAGYTGSAANAKTTNSTNEWNQSHVAMLGYSQQLSQKLSFGVTQLGGITYGGFGYGSAYGATGVPGLSGSFGSASNGAGGFGGGFGDLSNNGVVSGELLSSLIKFSSTSASVSYMLTRRWMVSGMGGVSIVRRSGGQYSNDAAQVGGKLSYLVTRRTQVGAEFKQMNSRYPSLFGGVSSQSALVSFQTQFSPTLTVGAGAGVGRMQSNFVGQIPIDPSLAALIGSGTVLQVTQTNFLTPYYDASLSKRFEMGSASIQVGRGSNAGNGVLIAGVQDMASASYSRTLNSRVGATWFASYNRFSGRVATLAVSRNMQTGGMLSVRVYRSVSLTAQSGMQYQSISTSPRRRDVYAGAGVAWTLTDHPFTF